MRNVLAVSALLASIHLSASTVAIIDSGTDMKHTDITAQAWNNPIDSTENGNDEDGNGFADDIFGWNFAEKNNEVIDYKYLGRLTDDIRKFFDVQGRMIKGQATQADRDWYAQARQDQDFIKRLSVYGNFMHGTHVGGIAIKGSDQAELLAVKLIPTEAGIGIRELAKKTQSGFELILVKMFLGNIADQQAKQLTEIAQYVHGHKADIANGSFGVGFGHAKMIVKQLAEQFGAKDVTEEQIEQVAKEFLNDLIKKTESMMAAAPDTLFVFAAGNEGTNNDVYPTSPTNVKAPNSISVAATINRDVLAPFSCYGTQMVEVAAPGVTINSAVPGDKYLEVSGTSQAAPYVANVASRVKDMNPELNPSQIKEVLMGTVDKKSWLQGKVKTSGLVNTERAVAAAELSKTMTLSRAIEEARLRVGDLHSKTNFSLPENYSLPEGVVAPLPSTIVLK